MASVTHHLPSLLSFFGVEKDGKEVVLVRVKMGKLLEIADMDRKGQRTIWGFQEIFCLRHIKYWECFMHDLLTKIKPGALLALNFKNMKFRYRQLVHSPDWVLTGNILIIWMKKKSLFPVMKYDLISKRIHNVCQPFNIFYISAEIWPKASLKYNKRENQNVSDVVAHPAHDPSQFTGL